MDQAVDWVIVGRFGKPHGIKGYVTVQSFTQPRDNILEYDHWHALIKGVYQPLKILDAQSNVKSIIVKIAGYDDRDLAARLTGIEIAVDAAQFPDLETNEYYWHELIGMRVVNLQDQDLGTVKEMISTGSNDVLVVEGTQRVLIPWILEQFIKQVDRQKGCITVDWDADF